MEKKAGVEVEGKVVEVVVVVKEGQMKEEGKVVEVVEKEEERTRTR